MGKELWLVIPFWICFIIAALAILFILSMTLVISFKMLMTSFGFSCT